MGHTILFYEHIASNWGDLAINTGAEQLLRAAGADPASSTIVRMRPGEAFARLASLSAPEMAVRDLPLSEAPKGSAEEIALLAEALEDPRSFAQSTGIDEHEVVLLNAGEHLFESSRGESTTDLLWRLLPAIAAAEVGRPAVLLPSTIGPFVSSLGERIPPFLDTALAASAYRDTESQRLAGRDGADRPVLLDPGFFAAGDLPAPRSPQQRDLPEHLGIVLRLEDAGLRSGGRRSRYVQAKNRASGYRESQAFRLFHEVATTVLDAGGTVSITVQTRSDREISAALHEALAAVHGAERVVLHDPETYEDFLAAIASPDLLVTSRFHTVILGQAQGVPAVGVHSETHGHKMPGLFGVLGAPQRAVRLDDRLPEHVAQEVLAASRDALASTQADHDRLTTMRESTAAWMRQALAAPARTSPATTDLRISALAALARRGTTLAPERDMADLQRSVQKLTRLLTQE